jgi:hypothetical protein
MRPIAADLRAEFPGEITTRQPHHVGNTASRGAVPDSLPRDEPDLAGIGVKVGSQGGSRLHWRYPLWD